MVRSQDRRNAGAGDKTKVLKIYSQSKSRKKALFLEISIHSHVVEFIKDQSQISA